RNSKTTSSGKAGFDDADPIFRKNDPSFKTRNTSRTQTSHQFKYSSCERLSSYVLYSLPRLYGGEVTTTSTVASPNSRSPATQSIRLISKFGFRDESVANTSRHRESQPTVPVHTKSGIIRGKRI